MGQGTKKSIKKVLLLVDNCPAHPNVANLSIKLVFLPPNTTSVLQPMDQGVIRSLKSKFRTSLIFKATRDIELKNESSITLIDAITMIASSWDRVTSTTISNSFKHAGITSEGSLSTGSDYDDFDDDDDVPLADWIQIFNERNIIPENVTWQDFVSVDDAIITTDEHCRKLLTMQSMISL